MDNSTFYANVYNLISITHGECPEIVMHDQSDMSQKTPIQTHLDFNGTAAYPTPELSATNSIYQRTWSSLPAQLFAPFQNVMCQEFASSPVFDPYLEPQNFIGHASMPPRAALRGTQQSHIVNASGLESYEHTPYPMLQPSNNMSHMSLDSAQFRSFQNQPFDNLLPPNGCVKPQLKRSYSASFEIPLAKKAKVEGASSLETIDMPMECETQLSRYTHQNYVYVSKLKSISAENALKVKEVLKEFTFPTTKYPDIYSIDFEGIKLFLLESVKNLPVETHAKLYEDMAIMLAKHIVLKNFNFPYLSDGQSKNLPFIDLAKAKQDFDKLLNLKVTDFSKGYVGMAAGQKMSNLYIAEERLNCANFGAISPNARWTNYKTLVEKLTKLFEYNRTASGSFYKCLSLSMLRGDFTMNAPCQFRPAAVFEILQFLKDKKIGNDITKILDLCAGWGDRQVGALAASKRFNVERYVATDPNLNLKDKYQKIFDTCRPMINTNFQCIIYDKPMEDLSIDELNPNGQQNDIMITSPPFHKYELYSDQLGMQSTTRYPETKLWIEKFMYKLVDQAKLGVRTGGFVAIHFSSASYDNIKVCEYLEKDMCKKLKKIEVISYLSRSKLRKKTESNPGEKIYIFQKID